MATLMTQVSILTKNIDESGHKQQIVRQDDGFAELKGMLDNNNNRMLQQLIGSTGKMQERVDSHESAIKGIEIQLGQISMALNNRPQGMLPADTQVNPKDQGPKQLMAVNIPLIDVLREMPGVAFEELKKRLVTTPIIVAPDLEQPFELMCDASDYAVGAVLGKHKDKVMHPIYYASRTLSGAQLNYTVTEKEILAVVFAFDKFRSYLIGLKVIVYIDHAALRLEGAEKKVEVEEIVETFLDEQLLATSLEVAPWIVTRHHMVAILEE
nr:uncharacterized protein LOC104113924 [Nicotiana tomentosiformis]